MLNSVGPSAKKDGGSTECYLQLHPAPHQLNIQDLSLAEELQVCSQEDRCAEQGLLPLLLLYLLLLLLGLLPQQRAGQEEVRMEERKEMEIYRIISSYLCYQ